MADPIRRMKAVNAEKIDIMDNATAAFIKSLDKALGRLNAAMVEWSYQLDGGERIGTNQRNLTRAVNSRAQIEEMLLEAGYRDSTEKLMKSYDKVADISMDLSRWERRGEDLAITIQEHIIDSVVGGSTFRDMAQAIHKTLRGEGDTDPAFLSQSETIANTALMGFDRTLSNRQAATAGIDTFIYLGPEDGLTRPFCQAVLDGEANAEFGITPFDKDGLYTSEQIAEMDNGQGLPPAQFGGGYNCRHKFEAIDAQVAQEINA
jgi:hypothetical protein